MTTAVALIIGAAGGVGLLGIVLLALRVRQPSPSRGRDRIQDKPIEAPPAAEPATKAIDVPRSETAPTPPRHPPELPWKPHAIVLGDGDEKLAMIEPLRTRSGWSVARDPRVQRAAE